MSEIVTAAMLVIGDEILSGRTKDKNIGFVADYLTAMGIDLNEVRIVGDDRDEIAGAVNALRAKYDYVFTSGGIGPTHDDITADSIAQAFDLPCEHDAKAVTLLTEHYDNSKLEFTEARMRMARMPRGATHIDNPVSKAPGFRVENVHVMAGVPVVMQAMMDSLAPTLRCGTKMISRHLDNPFGEGTVGGPLSDVQDTHGETMIGSYPRFADGKISNQIVVRGRDQAKVDAAYKAIEAMLKKIADKIST